MDDSLGPPAAGDAPQQPADAASPSSRLRVVGIGGSAGSVRALQAFFEALPDDCGMAFIVVLHLSPEHKSEMPHILQAKTEMRVVQVNAHVRMEPDHVYIIPPGKNIRLEDGALDVADFDEPRGQRMPIDVFFRSHAEHHPDGIAIVLTGTGSDGAVGIKHVKEAGALVMAQDPDEAEYDAMPRSAIATGVVDVVGTVRELAEHAVAYHRRSENGTLPATPSALAEDDERALRQILSHLRTWTEHDFSGYKHSTLLRRIARRMHIVGTEHLSAYSTILGKNETEAHALFRDLLISVTSFFRDPEAWEALAAQVLPHLFEGRSPEEPVRAWVAGCATGEEAYSLAILLAEQAALQEQPQAFQIFATDLDMYALQHAREGLYAEAISEDVTAPRLKRFFEREDHAYRVSKRLRERVLFAPHNVLKDPPFSKLDLVSCRNLLIYLQREQQQHVFGVFHYALRPGSTLFLGSTEGPDGGDANFATVDKAHRLFRRRPGTADPLLLPKLSQPGITRLSPDLAQPYRYRTALPSDAEAHLLALEAHAPPSVLVDVHRQILHLSGGAGRFLVHPAGQVTTNLLKTIRPELQDELRTALFRAFDRGEATSTRPVHVRFNGEEGLVYLIVRPVDEAGETYRRALVLFAEVDQVGTDAESAEAADDALTRQIEEELQQTREQLRLTSEEYETQREEMKARNEELQSMNEEYRSATEELETSKEELQSTNEELQTVNHELQVKVEEISQAHTDLQNLLDATGIATLYLDRNLCIQRFTANATGLFRIRPADVGRPLAELKPLLPYDDLLADARQAFDKLEIVEREIEREDGQWLLVRQRPYRTEHDHIAGVLLTFVDITAQKRAEKKAADEAEFASHIVDTVRESLLVLDTDLRVLSANQSFYATFAVEPNDTEGRLVYELGDGQWDLPGLRALLEEILPENRVFNDYEVSHTFEEIGFRTMLLNARRLDHQQRILLAIEDVTERGHVPERMEQAVREQTQKVRRLASALVMAEQKERRRLSAVLHDHLQQVLFGVQIQTNTLSRDAPDHLQAHTDKISELLKEALTITRNLTIELSPPVLKGEGMEAAIEWLGFQVKSSYGLKVETDLHGPFRIANEDLRVLLFQIVRELLFNVVKHADVDRAQISLREADEHLYLTVSDEGAGFDPAEMRQRQTSGQHVGLVRTEERLDLFGGHIELDTAPGKGTRVTVVLPLGGAPGA